MKIIKRIRGYFFNKYCERQLRILDMEIRYAFDCFNNLENFTLCLERVREKKSEIYKKIWLKF